MTARASTRARLPLAVALALAFGLMLVAALASVLGLAFYAGTANTRQLLADRTNLLLDTLEDRVETLLHAGGGRSSRSSPAEIATTADLDPTCSTARSRSARHPGGDAAGRGRRCS